MGLLIFKKNRNSMLLLLVVLCLVGFWQLTSRDTASNDSYWHIAMGERFIQEPFFLKDTFSFTYQGQEIISYPYLFEVGLYYLDKWLGYERLSTVFLYLGYVAGLALSLIYTRKLNAGWLASVLVVTGFSYFYMQRLLVRPDALFYPFMAIAMLCYISCTKKFTFRLFFGLFTLTVIWGNYHTPIFLYVIFAGLYLDIAIRYLAEKKQARDWSFLVVSGILLIAAGFLNPFMQNALLDTWRFDPRWKDDIVEYFNFFVKYLNSFDIYPLALLALLSIGLSVKTRSYGFLLIILVFTYQSIQFNRIVPFAGYILILFVIEMLQKNEEKANSKQIPARVLFVVLIFMFGYQIASKVFENNDGESVKEKPKNLVGYYKKKGYKGNIFNDYNVGGFLIYHLYPESKVYIDGRTNILYDYEFFKHQLRMLSGEKYLIAEDDKYGIGYLVIYTNSDFFLTAYHTGRYSLDYLDGNYALFKKGSSNFKVTGLVSAAPYCWTPAMAIVLKEESKNKNIANIDRDFFRFVETLEAFSGSKDTTAYLEKETNIAKDEFSKRFLAYRAFEGKDYSLASKYFNSLSQLKTRDYLVMAYTGYAKKNYADVLNAIQIVTTNTSMRFDDVDVLLLYDLILKVRDKINIPKEVEEIAYAIEMDLKQRNLLSYLDVGDITNLFCHPHLSTTGKYLAKAKHEYQ